MADHSTSEGSSSRVLFGWIAGFFATLIFHQLTLGLLWEMGLAPFAPYGMAASHPFGVPAVLSLAFWGGVWGIVFALVDGKFPRHAGYWVTAFVFGAIFPSLVALLVVVPLKGGPIGGGWHLFLWARAFLINGMWGIGTGVFLSLLRGWFGKLRPATA